MAGDLRSPVSFVRSDAGGDPTLLISSIRNIVWSIDSTVPLPRFQMLSEVVSESLAREVFLARISHPGGLRKARRARSRSDLARAVGCSFGSVSASVGIAGALAAGGLLREMLFGVDPTTLWLIASVALMMMTNDALRAPNEPDARRRLFPTP